MIQVYKRENPPEKLLTDGYQNDEVKEALLEDQNDKCYFCERKVGTDYEVEHLQSQAANKDKINEWKNLYPVSVPQIAFRTLLDNLVL